MAATINPLTPDQAAGAGIEMGFIREGSRRVIRSTPWKKDEGPGLSGFVDAAVAGVLRENTLASAWHEITDGDDARSIEQVKGYNPYASLKAKYDPETLDAIKAEISDGEFDLVRSDRQLDAVVKDILYERQLQSKAEQDGLGYFVGAVIGSLLDPTSYIPVAGAGAKVGRVAKMGLFALNAGLSAGVSEGVLQMTQRNRTLDETLMNIGTSAVIGGGLGIFAGALHPKSPLNPRNPDNPLARPNLRRNGEISVDMHGVKDELLADEIEELRTNYASVGAASLTEAGPRIARAQPKSTVGKVVRKVGDFFNSATIKGQVLRASADEARWVGVRIFDPAGIITEENLKGIGNARSATILKHSYMTEYETMMAQLAARTRQLSADLGKTKVDFKDILLVTQRHLYGMLDDKVESAMRSKYGSDFDKINEEALAFTEVIHKQNAVWEQRLTERGYMQDPAHVAKLETELKTLRDEIATHRAIGEFDTGDPKTSITPAQLEGMRTNLKLKAQELRAEKSKPAPLGRDYGHAQLWNRDAIFQNPSEFKAWLHDALALTPDEGWLIEAKQMTLAEFDALDTEAKRLIREEWAGDEYLWRIEDLELAAKSQQERLKEAKLDLMEAMRQHGAAKRDEADLSIQEARKRRDAINAEITSNRAHQDALRQEIRSFKEASDAAKRAGADRAKREAKGLQTTLEVTRDQRVARGVRLEDKLANTIEDVLTDPASPRAPSGDVRFQDAGDVAQLTDKVADNNVGIVRAEEKVRQDKDNVSVPTARQQGKAQEAAVGLQVAIREGEELAAKSEALTAKLREVEALHDAVTNTRRQLDDTVREAKVARKLAETDVRAIKRKLSNAKGKTPLNEMIEQVYDTLATRGVVPHGIVDRLIDRSNREVGRVKARGLHLSRELRNEAINKGWLRDDLSNILYSQHDQLASEFSLNEALEIGKGQRFESWDDVLSWVEDGYQNRMAETTDQATRNSLTAEMKRTVANLIEARDRLKGGNHIDDGTSNGWLAWSAAKMRRANLIRYGSGFLVSSLTDTATFALRHGSPAKALVKYGQRAIKMMTAAHDADPSHFKAMIQAVEIGSGAHAAAKRFGTEDALTGQLYGYGIGHGTTRKVTGAVDRGTEWLSEVGVKIGGLPLWNTFWKTVAGLDMLDRMQRLTRNYVKITPAEQADLATLGIGAPEARRIAAMMEKYGSTDADGFFDPQFEKWALEGDVGREAARDAELALLRDMNRSVNTPDVGDTGRLMTTLHGSILLQFQTFAFAFMNQFAYPSAQRIALFKEKQAMMSLGILMGSAMMVLVGKDIINGRNPADRFSEEKIGETLFEVVDRSGLLGWTSPFVDSALKLTSPVTGFAGGSRYARNNWVDSLFGINVSLVSDVNKAGAAIFSDAELGEKIQKMLVIHPFAMQAKLLGRFLNINDE